MWLIFHAGKLRETHSSNFCCLSVDYCLIWGELLPHTAPSRSWGCLGPRNRLQDLCNTFQLTFLTVGCLSRDMCGTAATTKEPEICSADDIHSFGFNTRTMMNAINSFWRKKWNSIGLFWENCMILFLTVKALTLDVRWQLHKSELDRNSKLALTALNLN